MKEWKCRMVELIVKAKFIEEKWSARVTEPKLKIRMEVCKGKIKIKVVEVLNDEYKSL